MYMFMLDKVLLPVAPSSLEVKINGSNKTINIMNNGEINQIKPPGLTEITFDIILPNVRYPFAEYKYGFREASYFLDEFEKLKKSKEPFQFIVVRKMSDKRILFDTNIKVTLENYTIREDKEDNGFDVGVSINLKQYKNFGTKTFKIKKNNKVNKKKPKRENKKSPEPKKKNKNYTVKRGDCLWLIARRFYGQGSKWPTIYKANKKKIKNPNLIYPGQVFVIPPLK